MEVSDARRWELLLCSGQKVASLVHQGPTGSDQSPESFTCVSVERNSSQHLFTLLDTFGQGGVDQFGPVLEVPVERHAANTSLSCYVSY